MRLKSLALKNYRQYKEATIEFADGITGIVGLNGAGKSTIVEAVAWILYGNNAARTDKEGIKRSSAPQSASVECELVMEIAGTEYKIVRILKGSSQTGDASMIAGGKVIADSVKGVEKEVNHLLGMDWKSFYKSFFAKQKELNSLTDATAAGRRDAIIRMLRIDAVDKVIDSIKKNIKGNKLELDILKKSLKDTNILTSEKLVIEKNKKAAEKELKTLELEVQKLEEEQSAFKAKFNEERAIFNKYNELEKKRTGAEARLTGLSKRESELNDELAEIKKLEKDAPKLEKEYQLFIDLTDKINKLHAVKERQKEVERSKEDIKKRLKELVTEAKELLANEEKLKKAKKCPTCGQTVTVETIEKHFMEEKNKMKQEEKRLKDLLEGVQTKFSQDEYEALIAKKKGYESSFAVYPDLKAQITKRSRSEEALNRIIKERKDIEADLKKILIDQKEIPYDEKKHEKITEEFDSVKLELDKKYSIRNTLKLDIERCATQAADKQKEIDDTEKAAREINVKTLSHQQQEQFIALVTDYRQFIISRIRPKLSEISGALLSELTNGKYTGVELDEEYTLWIYDGNIKYPLPRFSGGETDIANLCLRLAISQLIAESSGIETGFIILDEIFGSQDVLRKHSIMEALNRLIKQFRQIILITHIEDVKDTLENIFEVVENEEGISSIKA